MKTKYIIFDLDDTLIYEIDYLKSAYIEIAKTIDFRNYIKLFDEMLANYQSGADVFGILASKFTEFGKVQLLDMYRNHFPSLILNDGAKEFLVECKLKKYKLGLITDGRSITQRNKLKALKIEDVFDKIIVSEEFGSTKPDEGNFKTFLENEIDDYFYIADNPLKDFVAPNNLGWVTVCLLNKGSNIHSQNFDVAKHYLPKFTIEKLSDLVSIIS